LEIDKEAVLEDYQRLSEASGMELQTGADAWSVLAQGCD